MLHKRRNIAQRVADAFKRLVNAYRNAYPATDVNDDIHNW